MVYSLESGISQPLSGLVVREVAMGEESVYFLFSSSFVVQDIYFPFLFPSIGGTASFAVK